MPGIIAAQLLELEHSSVAESGDGLTDFSDKTGNSVPVEISAILDAEYDDFLIKSDKILTESGMGDSSLEDLFGDKVAFYFLCVRNGHGCAFTDCYRGDTLERRVAEQLNTLARNYCQLKPYVGDDGMVYVGGYEHLTR